MKRLLLIFLPVLLMTSATAAELATKKALSLDVAKELASAAQKFAAENDWNVNVAILDDGANLVYFERNDGVQIGSIDVALAKAETAVKFKRPTKTFAERIGGAAGIGTLPGVIAIEGGLPIMWEDEVIGSIGISGATSEQDGQIAQAAVDALPDILGN